MFKKNILNSISNRFTVKELLTCAKASYKENINLLFNGYKHYRSGDDIYDLHYINLTNSNESLDSVHHLYYQNPCKRHLDQLIEEYIRCYQEQIDFYIRLKEKEKTGNGK